MRGKKLDWYCARKDEQHIDATSNYYIGTTERKRIRNLRGTFCMVVPAERHDQLSWQCVYVLYPVYQGNLFRSTSPNMGAVLHNGWYGEFIEVHIVSGIRMRVALILLKSAILNKVK